MHHPWRTFAVVINKYIFGKTTGLDMLRELRAQILWAMYNHINVDYVALIWEHFMYQADNKEISSARKEYMPYPRFTKVIINHFISKDGTISMRNRINLYTIHDDTLLGTLKFVSKIKDHQKYGALIPDGMINQDIMLSTAYKTYLDYATRKFLLRRKGSSRSLLLLNSRLSQLLLKNLLRRVSVLRELPKRPLLPPTTGVVIKDTPGKSVSKEKAPAKTNRGKEIELLSDAALLEEAQLKETLRKSKKETHKLQASDSSEGVDFESEVPDEHAGKTKDISEGTGVKPGVLDASKEYSSDSYDNSWGDSEDESDDVHDEEDNDDEDEEEQYEEYVLTLERDKSDDEDKMYEEEDDDVAKEFSRVPSRRLEKQMVTTLSWIRKKEEQYEEYVLTLERDKSDDEDKMYEEEDDDVAKELYGDLNITQGLRYIDISNAEQGGEDQQNASHESGFVQKEEDAHFDQRVSALETKVYGFNQTSQFAKAISLIPGIVDNHLASKLKEEVNVAVRLQSNKLKEEVVAENQEFINQVDSTMKKIIKEQVKAQTSYAVAASFSEFKLKKILIDKMETNESINRSDIQRNLYNTLVESYNSDKDILSTCGDAVTLKRERDDQDKDEDPSDGSYRGKKRRKPSKDAKPSKGSKSKESKSSSSSKGTQSQPKSSDDQPDNKDALKHNWFQKRIKPLTPDHAWNKSKSIDFRPPQKWINTIAKECYKEKQPPYTFDELMGTPIDISAYVMNRLKIDNLTQEILVGPAFNLLKDTCKSFTELEYHFEECYKAINDRLDWHNPKGREYSFDLSKPLPLIEAQGHHVVPVDYFINNDLEYLKGRSSSSKYLTFRTRTKAAKYDNIDGIEDMFCDGTLSSVKMVVHDITSNLEMDYLPKRHWSNLEKKRSRIMIKAIVKLLFKMRLMRNLEKFIGGRDYGNDLRLLKRII
nr:hypothetical protein [Tanacetum cinerariifolium]